MLFYGDRMICLPVSNGTGGNPTPGVAERLADWFIGLNTKISKKLKAEPYKPLDRDGLVRFFNRYLEERNGFPLGEQAARLLSGLAFGQFLPNANHRTAMMLIVLWVKANGVDFSREPEYTSKARAYVLGSKMDVERAYERAAQFMGEKRQSYLWESYWPGHLRTTRRFLEGLAPVDGAIQSGIWGKTPQNHLEILLSSTSSEA